MLIQKKYFKWDDSKNEHPVKLRQSKDDLIEAVLISKLPNNEHKSAEYTGIDGFPAKVIFNGDLVEQIWFDQGNEFWYEGINLKEKVMNEGADCLWDYFEEVTAEYQGGDVLYAVISDGFVMMMALIAKS